MDQFKDLWIQTARERIQSLSDLLLRLERDGESEDLVNELMRTGHSLKGESGAMGYEQIATLAHVIEDLFTGIGKREITITPEIIDQLLAAIDFITAGVDSIESGQPELDCKPIVDQIKKLTGLKTEGFGKTDKLQSLLGDSNSNSATSTANVPTNENTPAEETSKQPMDSASGSTQEAAISSPTPTAEATDNKDQNNASAPTTEQTQEEAPKPATATKQVSTVTLKIEKLDQLLSVNEELVLLKMKLKNYDLVQENADLKAEIHRLDRLVTDMQFYLMQARLFPISLAFQTLPRLVRDTARKTEKKVRLEMEGEDTTVDRTIIDHLTEPFVHMIRNCIDHGIESPEKRREAGKQEEGVIHMKAYTKENKFFIDIKDDGAGIEYDKLSKKAIEKGLFTAEEISSWTAKDKEQLLYMDGLSASDMVTDVSGRGVGLGAVNQAIKKLGGSVSVSTEVGKGTTFTLRMPMTLAIMQSLLVKIADQTFALPGHEVIRSIQLDKNKIQFSGNRPVLVVDRNYVFLIDLAEKFWNKNSFQNRMNWEKQKQDPENGHKVIDDSNANCDSKTVVLVRQDDDIIGCLVDKIIAEEEILVKPLGNLLKHSTHFSGVTILADGSAAPIINLEGLKWKQHS